MVKHHNKTLAAALISCASILSFNAYENATTLLKILRSPSCRVWQRNYALDMFHEEIIDYCVLLFCIATIFLWAVFAARNGPVHPIAHLWVLKFLGGCAAIIIVLASLIFVFLVKEGYYPKFFLPKERDLWYLSARATLQLEKFLILLADAVGPLVWAFIVTILSLCINAFHRHFPGADLSQVALILIVILLLWYFYKKGRR